MAKKKLKRSSNVSKENYQNALAFVIKINEFCGHKIVAT